MSKRFEDVITRPHPIVSASKIENLKTVDQQTQVNDVAITEKKIESPRVRRRLTRLWSLAAVVAVTIVAIIVFQSITKASYQIPALSGLDEAQARNAVATFEWELIIRAERTNDVEFGYVIRTEPPAGVDLTQGDALVLFVSEGPPLGVLADLTGQSRDAAVKQIVDQGLTFASQEEFSETIPVGNIISWIVAKQPSLVAGDEVLQGTLINIVVSNGPAPRAVPLIVGMNLVDATAAASELGLVLSVSPESYSLDVAAGLIGAQAPPPEQKLPRGGSIVYSISLGQDLVELPNIVGINFFDVEKRLVASGFVVGDVTGRKSFRMKSASVNGVAVNNGDMVPRGSAIDMIFP